ncbi:MAG: hypothetical protein WA842_08460 [Croceibacterium sp.]
MRKIATYTLAAAAIVAATAAVAQSGAARPERAGPPTTRAAVTQFADTAFARMDRNSDGVLNQADREARQKAAFDRIDADRNGNVTFAEFNAQREHRREARAERRGEGGGERRMGQGRHGGMRGHSGQGMAMMADKDKDGTVTKAEFAAAALARFDQADTDKNGTISDTERRAARQQMRGHMRPQQAS